MIKWQQTPFVEWYEELYLVSSKGNNLGNVVTRVSYHLQSWYLHGVIGEKAGKCHSEWSTRGQEHAPSAPSECLSI